MISKIMEWLRDNRRGFSDTDIKSAKGKLDSAPDIPGAYIFVTKKELRAILSLGLRRNTV